jgi:integrase
MVDTPNRRIAAGSAVTGVPARRSAALGDGRSGRVVNRLAGVSRSRPAILAVYGEHPQIVQERLGHSDISMTLGRYSHVTMDMQREAAVRMAVLLGG